MVIRLEKYTLHTIYSVFLQKIFIFYDFKKIIDKLVSQSNLFNQSSKRNSYIKVVKNTFGAEAGKEMKQ